ncbi:hypothetical protein Ciccas_003174 [Cichlidogyrus casuarinus]|uniref:Choline/carnitine acyltransferase domain-containing protein n=1 Tax=Cichlidogyrus casuarinus TaxID=1844966 RepID=A0ABD2QHE4_9PLAT
MVLRLTLLVFVFFISLRRFLIRRLLSCQPWMNDRLGKVSLKTKLWAFTVSLLEGFSKPGLYGAQEILPSLPLPPVDATLQKLTTSLTAIYSPAQLRELQHFCGLFRKKSAWKLQFLLRIRHLLTHNYVTEWWEKYIYLMQRSSLVTSANYYALSYENYRPSNKQSVLLAAKTYSLLRVKQQLETEVKEPIFVSGCVPVCMGQYRRLFSVTRIPCKDFDRIQHYRSSHSVVQCHGLFYKIPMYRHGRMHNLLEPWEYQLQVEYILAHAEQERGVSPRDKDPFFKLAALTQVVVILCILSIF